MAECIEREAFLKAKREQYCTDCNRRKNSKGKMVYDIGDAPCRACRVGDMLDDVEDFPAADVAPVRHGKYITDDMGDSSCSECGAKWLDVTENFCPNCGARMEESLQLTRKTESDTLRHGCKSIFLADASAFGASEGRFENEHTD